MTSAMYVCVSGWGHRRSSSRHFPPICTVPIQDQAAPALLPQRSSSLLLILSPPFLVLHGSTRSRIHDSGAESAALEATETGGSWGKWQVAHTR